MKSICRLPLCTAVPLMLAVATIGSSEARAQYGTVFSGTGPINRSFGGVSVAAPLDASGVMFWNPAAMTGLQRSEMDGSVELMIPRTELSSQVPANTFGPGFPPINMAGTTSSDTGVFALPTISFAYLPQNSRWSFGLGVFALAGFGVDYPGSTTNPILTPPPPNGLGLGPMFSQFQVFQIHPALAYQITDRLSIAAGPTIDLAQLSLDPAVVAAPDDANGDTFATYPSAMMGKSTWGGGFVIGTYYRADTWAVGASYKSPQWFDAFRFNSADERGFPRSVTFQLDLPMIVSVGGAYTGLDRWIFAADLRYIDYKNADGLGTSGFAPDGALRGTGWESVFAAAFGTQWRISDTLSLRAGYGWNENPIPASQSFANMLSPLVLKNVLSIGASWNVTEDFILSVAYLHGFQNSISGPLITPLGAVPGTSIENTTWADSIVFGASIKFGGCRTAGCDQL